MKRKICLIVTSILLLSLFFTAFAAGTVQQMGETADWKNLTVDVAISGSGATTFYASVDGCNRIAVDAQNFPAHKIGHIIVVDMGYSWTSHISTLSIQTALQAYLKTIPSDQMVKFILAQEGQTLPTAYMPVANARNYVSSLVLPSSSRERGEPSSTNIGNAISAALTEAGSPSSSSTPNTPAFLNVFALVDLGNQNASSSGSNLTGKMQFPVTIAALYPDKYMEGFGESSAAGQKVTANQRIYNTLAQNCGTTLLQLSCNELGNVTTSALSSHQNKWNYYTVNLSPLHSKINYSKNTHDFILYTSNSFSDKGTTLPRVSSNELPTAPVTATPKDMPSPTPDPYRVHANDKGQDALRAVLALQDLYYLDEDTDSFDSACQKAYMVFCKNNGLKQEINITHEAFALLTGGRAIPKETPTPTPTTAPPTATPSPTIAPRIYNGCDNTSAIRLISRMQDLFYLDSGKRDKWDSECMVAFQQMCEANGISYDKEYIDDEMYAAILEKNLQPKATPTPYISPSPIPTTTISPDGYRLFDQDSDGASFIANMQTVLQKLNLFDEAMKKGVIDQPTMNAIIKYCEHYGLILNNPQYADHAVVTDILENGPSRTPYIAPEPSTQEKAMEFLQREALQFGSLSIKIWVLVVIVVALVFAILVLIITTNHKSKVYNDSSFPPKTRTKSEPDVYVPSPDPAGNSSDGETMPVNIHGLSDTGETMPVGHGLNVTLTITGGVSAGTYTAMINNSNYILGRPHGNSKCDLALDKDNTISRKHAVLRYESGQLKLFHQSTTNDTKVNGRSIAAADSGETMAVNAASSRSDGSCILNRGDVIEIGVYRITVNW